MAPRNGKQQSHLFDLQTQVAKLWRGYLEFLREIRKDAKLCYLPVFILSTSRQENDVQAAYDLNAAGYIMKPLAFESFVSSISTLESYWTLIEHVEGGE